MGSISRTGRVTIDILSIIVAFTKRHKRGLFAIGLWLMILFIIRTMMVIYNLTLTEVADVFTYILRNAWYGLLLFLVLYLVRPLLLMPGTLMNFMAGMVYGFPLGFTTVVVASLISATTTYSLSRWLIHNQPQSSGRAAQFITFMRRHPFEAIMTMQLTYLSLDFTSSMAGVLHLPYRHFILGVLVGGFVGNGLGVLIGTSIDGSIANGTITIQPEIILISLAVFAVSISISSTIRNRNPDLLPE